jgi:hypothetical protein
VSPPTDDGAVDVGATPAVTSFKKNAPADDQSSKHTAAGHSPEVGVQNVLTANPSADGVVKLAAPMAKKTTRADNLGKSTGQDSVTRPEKKGNLKNDEDYETGERGDPWDKIALSEINDQYYAVAVGKNQNSFGIDADVKKIKKE